VLWLVCCLLLVSCVAIGPHYWPIGRCAYALLFAMLPAPSPCRQNGGSSLCRDIPVDPKSLGGSGPKNQNFQLAPQTLTLTCKVTSTCGMDVPVSELQNTRGKTFCRA
jgi:hypothetical protein